MELTTCIHVLMLLNLILFIVTMSRNREFKERKRQMERAAGMDPPVPSKPRKAPCCKKYGQLITCKYDLTIYVSC